MPTADSPPEETAEADAPQPGDAAARPGTGGVPLVEAYLGLVCDLDGVVYHGPAAVAGAIEALHRVRTDGRAIVYATNNASRPPAEVADHLRSLGLELADADVINSSVAGAHVLRGDLPAGSPALAVGGKGVAAALIEVGLQPVLPGEETAPVAVLQGYGAAVTATDLAEAAYAIQGGARWVVTNTDRTLPTDRGTAPGNGTLVGAVQAAVQAEPEVVGKPEPTMYAMAAQQLNAPVDRLLGIGDRLETDIAGAHAAGMPALLVLTGVHGVEDVIVAAASLRPDFVVSGLEQLYDVYVAPQVGADGGWTCGGARAHVTDDGLALEGEGDERLRVAVAALWDAIDDDFISSEQALQLWRSSVAPSHLAHAPQVAPRER